MRALLAAGAEVNALEHQLQSTPLGRDAHYGNSEVVHYLLQRDADPNRSGADCSRPLAWAEKQRHREIADLLRSNGAN